MPVGSRVRALGVGLGALGLGLTACHTVRVRPPPPVAAKRPAPAPPTRRAPAVRGATHVVKAGETLYRIARAYGTTPQALARANHIADPTSVAVGTALVIPGAPRTLPLPDLSLDGASVDAASAGTRVFGHAPGCTGARCLSWPLRGVIYARFGPRAGEQAHGIHEGLDLAAPEGTPIAAAADGVVLYAGQQPGYGTLVILQHPGGLITLYAHNAENLVKDGQHVRDGQIIARVGQSGRTSGPHCHFEVRKDEKPVDPLRWLPSPSSALARAPR